MLTETELIGSDAVRKSAKHDHSMTLHALTGVRSLTFLDHLLSCGSGRGRMFFFDLRASAYLELDPLDAPPVVVDHSASARPVSNLPDRTTNFLQCGPGYLNQTDTVYL